MEHVERRGKRSRSSSRSRSATRLLSTPGKSFPIEDEDERNIKAAENHFNPEWGLSNLDDNIKGIINNLQGHERLGAFGLKHSIMSCNFRMHNVIHHISVLTFLDEHFGRPSVSFSTCSSSMPTGRRRKRLSAILRIFAGGGS